VVVVVGCGGCGCGCGCGAWLWLWLQCVVVEVLVLWKEISDVCGKNGAACPVLGKACHCTSPPRHQGCTNARPCAERIHRYHHRVTTKPPTPTRAWRLLEGLREGWCRGSPRWSQHDSSRRVAVGCEIECRTANGHGAPLGCSSPLAHLLHTLAPLACFTSNYSLHSCALHARCTRVRDSSASPVHALD